MFGALPASGFVCAGIPFDGTASSRPGAAEGPRAIRVASLVYSSYVDSLGEDQMVDLRSGARFVYRRPVVCDVGDLHVFPTDVRRTLRTVAAEVARLQGDGRVPILLGGDHSITVPCVAGVLRGRPDAAAEGLGFVHIDHHFDRTSSSPGVGAATRRVQLDMLLAAGFNVVTASDIRRLGAAQALEPALDVCAGAAGTSTSRSTSTCSTARSPLEPATSPSAGLSGGELFDVLDVVAALPIVAMDVVEVSPRYDPSGRTAHIAARALFELLYRPPVTEVEI